MEIEIEIIKVDIIISIKYEIVKLFIEEIKIK